MVRPGQAHTVGGTRLRYTPHSGHSPVYTPTETHADTAPSRRRHTHWAPRTHPSGTQPLFSAARRARRKRIVRGVKSLGSAHRRRGARVSNKPQQRESHRPSETTNDHPLQSSRPARPPLRPSPGSRCGRRAHSTAAGWGSRANSGSRVPSSLPYPGATARPRLHPPRAADRALLAEQPQSCAGTGLRTLATAQGFRRREMLEPQQEEQQRQRPERVPLGAAHGGSGSGRRARAPCSCHRRVSAR